MAATGLSSARRLIPAAAPAPCATAAARNEASLASVMRIPSRLRFARNARRLSASLTPDTALPRVSKPLYENTGIVKGSQLSALSVQLQKKRGQHALHFDRHLHERIVIGASHQLEVPNKNKMILHLARG